MDGGVRAVEQLRTVLGALQVAVVSAQVALTMTTDFEGFQRFRPGPHRSDALAPVRAGELTNS